MNWFLASGDAPFFYPEQIRALSWLPGIMDYARGFGESRLPILWLDYPFQIVTKLLSTIGLSWWVIDKLLWVLVFGLAAYASYRLARYVLENSHVAFLCPLIYIGNTYFLLLFGGGQLGVALAYGLSPYVLYRFIKFIDRITINKEVSSIKYLVSSIQNGLWLALLICFDLRLAYLVMGAVLLYLATSIMYRVLSIKYEKKILYTLYFILYTFIIPLLVAIMVHMFWILPIMMVRGGASGIIDVLTNPGMLKFLSFADFSHTLSLLHPNWPENLFGRVYFLQPEFLVLPLLAFGGLLFYEKSKMSKRNKRDLYFFALLGLLGAFLAKGAGEPFGGVYIWFFDHIPGFVMFRDPTKFYLFIALGYSVLIPFTLLQLAHVISIKYYVLSIKYKNGIHNTLYFILYTLFVIFWLFTIRAVFTGRVAGNFRPLVLTNEYITLKDLLVAEKEPYRTLWLPRADKFVYSSDIHPLLTGDSLWKNASMGALLTIVDSPEFPKTILNAGVRYIIVPADIEKRIFLSDYRYDQSQRDALIEAVSKTGLQKLPEFQQVAVFENPIYTFHAEIPEYVEKQEYWARVGLAICIVLIGWLLLNFRKSIAS